MRSRLTPVVFLSAVLTSGAAQSDWSSNFEPGTEYSDIVDIGRLGARKQLVLPPNPGSWRFLGSQTRIQRVAHAFRSATEVDAKFGEVAFVNTGGGKHVAVLLTATASIEADTNASPADVCIANTSALFQNLYPSFTSRRKPKCLTIDRIRSDALGEMAQRMITETGLQPLEGELLRLTMATSDSRYGSLIVTFVSKATDSTMTEQVAALKAWGDQYVTRQLEDSLSHSLDEPQIKEPYPIVGVKTQPVPTMGTQVQAAQSSTPRSVTNEYDDVPTLLQKLKSLMDQGVISEEEFAAKKAELLKRL